MQLTYAIILAINLYIHFWQLTYAKGKRGIFTTTRYEINLIWRKIQIRKIKMNMPNQNQS